MTALNSPTDLFNAMYYQAGQLVQDSFPLLYIVLGVSVALLASVLIVRAFKAGAHIVVRRIK
jgi:hypothetical protein